MFPGAARFKVKPLMAPQYCTVEACSQGGHIFLTGHRDTTSNGGQEVQFGGVRQMDMMVMRRTAVWLESEGVVGGSSSHPGFDTSPQRAKFRHRLSDLPLPLVNCRNSFMLRVLLFYGHGPGEWLCRTPQLTHFCPHGHHSVQAWCVHAHRVWIDWG